MAFVLNQVIDNYECLGIIDKPRVGATYKVRNLATGELEALRALPGAASSNPESVERLLREIRVHTRLSHPNIIGFHDAFEIDGQLVMTTELVEGPTLAELCREGPLPPCDAIGMMISVLEGLEEAHALGIVHRGITAEHVIVTSDGAVKLGGFGSAKPASDINLTQMGAVIGDPRYISPEQVTGHSLDGRSDLYSVGVLLYKTLTGKMPFEGLNDFEVLAAHVGSKPKPPSSVNPAISPELDRIVLTALRKSPDERFSNAREFRAALAAAETATLPPVVNRPYPVPPRSLEQHQSRRPVTAPMVIGLLVLAIGLAIISWVAMH